MIKSVFGEIFNMLNHFKAPVKDLFKILIELVSQKNEVDSSTKLEEN